MDGENSQSYPDRKLLFMVLLISIVALVLSLLSFLRNYPQFSPSVQPSEGSAPPGIKSEQQAGSEIGAPVVNPATGEQSGVKCPTDSCSSAVYGAGKCPNSDEAYNEQECYDYPEQATSLSECYTKRTVYYKICGVRQ